jgi:hypothetical protein
MNIVRQCLNKNFSIIEQRREALTLIHGAYKDCPFDRTHEFPEYSTYVCLQLYDWPNKMDQCIEALNFNANSIPEEHEGTRSNKTGMLGHVKTKGNDSRIGFFSGDDALHAYHQSLVNMQKELAALDGVFGKRSLESRLGIVWA